MALLRSSIKKVLSKINLKKNIKIKWIHLSGAGVEKYSYLKKFKNITFTNDKIIQGIQVADHAMALLLTLTRNINLILKGGQKTKFKTRPIELEKALIVGYGGVGKCLAKRAYSFGMDIKVVKNNHSKCPKFIKKIFLSNELHLASKNIDVLFITMPLTNKSKKIINEKIIKKLNKGLS